MTRVASILAVACLALPACSKPEPPEKDRPPEPTAASTTQQPSALRRYMQAPIEKAKTAETTVLDAGAAQRDAIDAQTQGNSEPQAPAQSPDY